MGISYSSGFTMAPILNSLPSFCHCLYSAVAAKSTSPDELIAVSSESWTTPMIIPTATACMDISCGIPNSEHAIGMSNSEPPATPEAPHAPRVAIRLSMSAVGTSTDTPMVFATESAIIVIVMAAPSILMVAPSGMDTEYTSKSFAK